MIRRAEIVLAAVFSVALSCASLALPHGSRTTPIGWDVNNSSGIVVSGSGFLATSNDPTNGGVQSIRSNKTGKFFVEFTMGTVTTAGIPTKVGLSTDNWCFSCGSSLGRTPDGGVSYDAIGSAFVDSTQVFGLDPYTNGAVVDLAVDFGAMLFWGRVNGGSWNGSGTANPATGIGGIDLSAIYAGGYTGPLFAAYQTSASGDSTTVNLGQTGFSFPAPAGYSAWGQQ